MFTISAILIDRPCTFTKRNLFIYLTFKERHSAPTFLFLLAIFFSQCESPLIVTCQSLRTLRDDSYADVVFNDLGHGPEKQTPHKVQLVLIALPYVHIFIWFQQYFLVNFQHFNTSYFTINKINEFKAIISS